MDKQATLRKKLIKAAVAHPEQRDRLMPLIARLVDAAAPKYQDYVERKQNMGEKPLDEKAWERKVLQTGISGDELKEEKAKGAPAEGTEEKKPEGTAPKKTYKKPVQEVMQAHNLTDDDATEVEAYRKKKPLKPHGTKSDAQLMQEFLAHAKPETKERMKDVTPAEFVKMLGAIMDEEEGGEGMGKKASDDRELRKAILKLAVEQPKLRGHLMPILAGEFPQLQKTAMEFDTKEEMEEYRKNHKVRPDTKMTVKKHEEKKPGKKDSPKGKPSRKLILDYLSNGIEFDDSLGATKQMEEWGLDHDTAEALMDEWERERPDLEEDLEGAQASLEKLVDKVLSGKKGKPGSKRDPALEEDAILKALKKHKGKMTMDALESLIMDEFEEDFAGRDDDVSELVMEKVYKLREEGKITLETGGHNNPEVHLKGYEEEKVPYEEDADGNVTLNLGGGKDVFLQGDDAESFREDAEKLDPDDKDYDKKLKALVSQYDND